MGRKLVTKLQLLKPGKHLLFSILVGMVGSLSYFENPISGVAWIWPFLLLISVQFPLRKAFLGGWTSGFSFFATSMYWLWYNPFPQGAVPGWVALSLYAGLYFAVWTSLTSWVWTRLRNSVGFSENQKCSPFLLRVKSHWPHWVNRLIFCLFAAALWTVLEWLRSYLLTGFPWNLLGVSQATMPMISTLAKWSGVSLISFLICFVSLNFGFSVIEIVRKPGDMVQGLREISPTLILFGAILISFNNQLISDRGSQDNQPTKSIKIGVVQPGFTQHDIWSREESKKSEMWDVLEELTQRALTQDPKPDLILWPEGAVSGMTYEKLETVSLWAQSHQTAFIISITTIDENPSNLDDPYYFNSAIFINEKGEWMNNQNEFLLAYHKQHLVPFGEFIPLVSLFPWLEQIIPVGQYQRGKVPGTFYWEEMDLYIALSICFEDVMASLTRQSINENTQILINLTNDAWFGRSSAQWQHARTGQFRAIELGIPIARAANNGLSFWADTMGRVYDVGFDDPTVQTVYDAGVKQFHIPVGIPQNTLYKSIGDWFSFLSFCAVTAYLIWIFIRLSKYQKK